MCSSIFIAAGLVRTFDKLLGALRLVLLKDVSSNIIVAISTGLENCIQLLLKLGVERVGLYSMFLAAL
jgi:hypothetical protein